MKDQTMLIHFSEDSEEYKGAIVPPIFQNSLFAFDSWDAIDKAFDNPADEYIYTRGNNPTTSIVEEKIAKLANGESAKMFASGMGAISSAILHCVKYNEHIISISNVYGPANAFISGYLKEKCNISSTFVKGLEVSEFEDAIQDNTTLIYLESPSSAIFSLQDIEEIVKIAKPRGIKVVIDNTWATPVFQKPLDMGVDLEVHSCSKYFGGHSDIIAGVVIGKKVDIDEIKLSEAAWLGAKIAPFEAWLILRSLRTFSIRMKAHCENTNKIIEFLKTQDDKIKTIYHPTQATGKQKELFDKQMSGYTGLLAFDLKCEDVSKIKDFVNNLNYFKLGVSWGGHDSLVYAPAISYLKELSPEKFKAMNISLGTIRVSIGLEDVDDLIADLRQALDYV